MKEKIHDSSNQKKEWLSPNEVCEYLSCSKSYFYQMMKQNEDFPKGYFITDTKKLWKREEIDHWINHRSKG